MKDDLVMIGDYLGTIEEYMPGEGTYAEEGKIYASKIGKKVLDAKKHMAIVEGKKIPEIKVGQTVFGEVQSVRKSVVNIIVSMIAGEKGDIDEKTMIYVSNISDKYVSSPEDFFRIGDIVKATVIKVDPGMIDLSTKGPMGVVKAFCTRCRLPLELSSKYKDKMECSSCGHVEVRKIADDYGKTNIL